MIMEGSGIRVMAVVAISGCSLLLMALNRRRFVSTSRVQPHHEREEDKEEESTASPSAVYSLKSISSEETPNSSECFGIKSHHTPEKSASPVKKNKKVRFSEDVEEPSSNNAEYRRRHARRLASGKRRREKGMETSEVRCDGQLNNRRALYNGMAQFRSQRATAMPEKRRIYTWSVSNRLFLCTLLAFDVFASLMSPAAPGKSTDPVELPLFRLSVLWIPS